MSNYVRRVYAFADTIVYCLIKNISFIEDEKIAFLCLLWTDDDFFGTSKNETARDRTKANRSSS